jgi:Flp pilus assembly protein TadG
MFGSIKRFGKDRKGAFAMQFALMAIPLTVCTGLAIDGGRAFLARFELASALDAAALAVGSTYNAGADLEAIAKKFVNTNFRTEHDDPIDVQLVTTDTSVTVKGKVTINTYFMPLVGQPHVTVEAESEVRRGGSNIEVAVALDVTGSMSGARIAGLKDAAQVLVDEVVNVSQTPYFSKIAIVPWSAQVHVGATNVDATAPVELRGTPTGPTSVTAASWRKTATTTKTVSQAGWRTTATAGGKSISGVSWKNGSSYSISGITKTNSNTRIRIQTSSNPGYANGDTVYITGANGSFTGLNGNMYKVADRTTTSPYYYWLQDIGTSTYTTPPSGSSAGTAGTSQRCYDTACNVAITTSSSHTLSVGDYAHVTGVSGFTAVNNANDESWVVAAVPSTTIFTITMPGVPGPSLSQTYSTSSSDKASECLVSDCRYRVTTSAAHGLSASDYVFIWGMSEGSGTTSAMTAANASSTIDSPSGSVFYLPGNGVNYKDWSSGGSVAACALSTCNTQVTITGQTFAVNDYVRIDGATGLTGINNCTVSTSGQCSSGSNLAWQVSAVSGDVYTLADTTPALSGMSGTYGSSGAAQCTTYGCNRMYFLNASNSPRLYQPSNCLVERYGDEAYTDVGPSTAPLGMLYSGDGACDTSNYVTPLTSNTARLTAAVNALSVGGSTAGQMGIAWAWYMLSPNFADVWDKEDENKPKAYTASELAKIAILMTDGEFNFATCNGVSNSSISSSICVPDDAGDNTVGKHYAFKQAEKMCDAMKAQDITIYTVGLELDTSLYSDDFLLKCASSPAHAFLAANVTELKDAFAKIAINISKLRIAR